MQGQGWHKKQKYQNQSYVREKDEHDSSKLLLVHLKEMSRPRCRSVPKSVSNNKIENGEYDADDKGAEEKIPEENDLFAFHLATFLQLLVISKKPDQ
jgi:hypothetical protein